MPMGALSGWSDAAVQRQKNEVLVYDTKVEIVNGHSSSSSSSVAVALGGTDADEETKRCRRYSPSLKGAESQPQRSKLEKELGSLLGRIEIVWEENVEENDKQEGAARRSHGRLRIICLPPSSFEVSSLFPDGKQRQQQRKPVDEASSISTNEDQSFGSTVFEQIANTFMDSCGPECHSSAHGFPKSALRKSGEGRNHSHNVKFDKIDIREFKLTLGNHPSAISGPPMAIDWNREARVSSFPLDEYEKKRRPRRNRKELKIPMKTRCGILTKEGHFSAVEITQAWEEALLVRKQRHETLRGGVSQMAIDEFWESANRKLKRVTDTVSNSVSSVSTTFLI